MKKIIITILYWIIAVLLVSAVLMSLEYEFRGAFFISMMLVPGCMVLKFIIPKLSFSNFRKGLSDLLFISAAVMVTELLFIFCSHVAVIGLPAVSDGHSHIPMVLINPAFLTVIMAFLTGGDFLLSRYLKAALSDEPKPIVFTSEYKKVSLDESEIMYVESRDTEVWVCATEGRKFRNKTGITQWENLLGEDFIRVHRAFLVNRQSIESVAPDSIILKDRTEIPVSRKYRSALSTHFSSSLT